MCNLYIDRMSHVVSWCDQLPFNSDPIVGKKNNHFCIIWNKTLKTKNIRKMYPDCCPIVPPGFYSHLHVSSWLTCLLTYDTSEHKLVLSIHSLFAHHNIDLALAHQKYTRSFRGSNQLISQSRMRQMKKIVMTKPMYEIYYEYLHIICDCVAWLCRREELLSFCNNDSFTAQWKCECNRPVNNWTLLGNRVLCRIISISLPVQHEYKLIYPLVSDFTVPNVSIIRIHEINENNTINSTDIHIMYMLTN